MSADAKKSCFIITPIGEGNSETRRKADGVINSAIKPVLESKGYGDIKAAHEITSIGSINNQVISRVVNDDLVIANLTGLNPNVMYELAIRHATMKSVVHICEYGTSLPFDIKDQRTIFYANDMLGVQELISGLDEIINEIGEKDKFEDNPIYNAIRTGKILQDTTTDEPIKYIVSKMADLESKIDKINKNSKAFNQLNYEKLPLVDNNIIRFTDQSFNTDSLLGTITVKEAKEK